MAEYRIPILVGPTASGKTTLALALAPMLGCEIVSADSRQVYRYLNIGTAKPSARELQKVPHHCIDIIDPDDYYSAGQYCRQARRAVKEIRSRGVMPLVVGGSGLYIQALAEGVFASGSRDDELRDRLKREAREKGTELLHDRLRQVDPKAAETIHPRDLRRIVRALEVWELSGKPISQLQEKNTEPADFYPLYIGVTWPRPILYDRINRRVDRMIQEGLVEEVSALLKKGYNANLNSLDSVGYKEIIAYLQGRHSREEAVELIKRNTRRFAKRQLTWFRRLSEVNWFGCDMHCGIEEIRPRVAEYLRSTL